MARPERHDADYFPFYVKDGKTLFILETKYGLQGIGFFTNLMRFLTRQTDHHICIKEESDKLYFFAQIKCPEDIGMDMLNLMAKTGKIDRELWEKHQIIVCEDLLNSLKDAYRKRRNKIIAIDEIRVFYGRNEVSYGRNSINSVNNPQTKLKKTKLKKTKVEERGCGGKQNIFPTPPCADVSAPTSLGFEDFENNNNNGNKPSPAGAKKGATEMAQLKVNPAPEDGKKPPVGAKKGVIRPGNLDDEAWLAQLKVNPAYEGLDIDRCFWKMLAWCEINGKEPTRRRFVNWLNREERPLRANNQKPPGLNEADILLERIRRGEL